MQLGAFGTIVFETSDSRVRTWQQMSRKGGARFAKHVVAEGKPRLEFLGPDLEELNISIRLSSQLGVDPEAELAEMRAIRDAGEEKTLVIGGLVIGKFVLEDLNEEHRRHDGYGGLLLAEVQIKLTEYVTDGN